MNFRQLQYAVRLSRVLNFSQVAEQFQITQPALSKQILSLESELGVRLFDRSTSPLTLTPAGESFFKDARDLLYREDQLRRSMERYREGTKGRLVIGISPFRSLYLVADMIRTLQEKYPDLQVILDETDSADLHKGAVEGRFDFAIINLPVDEVLLDSIPLRNDERVLAVPERLLPLVRSRDAEGAYPMADLSDCEKLPFIVLPKGSEMRDLFDRLCVAADLRPNITTEVVGNTTAWALARAGIAAAILPLQFAESMGLDQRLHLFALKQEASSKQPAIIIKKGAELTPYAAEAIEMLKARFG